MAHNENMYMKRIYAEIDLDRICENVRNIKARIGERKFMAIIKADGYGHGSVPIARELSRTGLADAFGIATVDEAEVLRRCGINEQILVLGYTFPEQYESLLENNITQTIFQYKAAKQLSDVAVRLGMTARIHLKIDTGMGRIGFVPSQESLSEIKRIASLKNICIEGIFTHFARADMKDDSAVFRQKELFDDFVKQLEDAGIRIPVKHTCNSAAILEYEECFGDMVRSGIITYGLYPSDIVNRNSVKLKPALEIKSHVSYVKTINAGDTVSYASTFVAEKPTVVATVPIGYADGYPRSLQHGGRVLINGCYANIIGRICMDQFMVDATDIPDVKQGDLVTVVGSDGENEITFDELAQIVGSISYELVCGISRRVPRVYKRGGKNVQFVDYLDFEYST